MIKIPLYLAIAQWALLAALGVLVVILFRQLGRLMSGTASSAAELGPPAGSQAAALTYARPGATTREQVRPGDGQPLLLAFVDPTCPSCEELVTVLDGLLAAGDLDGVRPLLLISDPPSYLQISPVFSGTRIEIGRPDGADGMRSYRVSATPLLVAIDAGGTVRAAGSVVQVAQVRAYARSCLLPEPAAELAVVSGQDSASNHRGGDAE
jgi:hypothetical protein